jgi:hypothetical protein
VSPVAACSSETVLEALERSAAASADPATALRDTVDALWAIAAQAAREGAFDEAAADAGGASLRVELMHYATRVLVSIIRRGVAAGAFRPLCSHWAERGLVHALVAAACARWVFDLPEARSLRAGPAADAALEVLRGGGQ